MSPECKDGSRSWRVYRAAGRPARFGVCDDARTSAASLVKSGLGRTRIMAKVKHPPAPCEMGEETARLRALPWQEKEKGRDERPTDQSADDDGDEEERKSVVQGKRVSVRVGLGGRRTITKQTT